MIDTTMPKRGPGRPKGSTNRAKVERLALSPEEAEAPKRELANGYAEAVAYEAHLASAISRTWRR